MNENTHKRRGRPPKGRTAPPVETLPAPSNTVSYKLTPEGGRTVTVKGVPAPKTVVSRGVVSKVTGRPVKFTKTYGQPMQTQVNVVKLQRPVPLKLTRPEGDFTRNSPVKKYQLPGTFHDRKSILK